MKGGSSVSKMKRLWLYIEKGCLGSVGMKLRIGVISYVNVSVGMGLVSVTSTELGTRRKKDGCS